MFIPPCSNISDGSGAPSSWWGGLIYAIGVFSWLIGSIVFGLWFWGCFD